MVSKGLDKFVVWPHYFDRSLSRAQGRRVPDALAVKDPDAEWLEATAKRLGYTVEVEDKVAHPSVPYERSGRVLVGRKGTKQAILAAMARKMRESQDAKQG